MPTTLRLAHLFTALGVLKWWLLLSLVPCTVASVCSKTGESAPEVVTVMASKGRPATEAWVVYPNCTVTTITVDTNGVFSMNDTQTQRVESVPSTARTIKSFNNDLWHGANFSLATNATSLYVQKTSQPKLDLILPSSLTSMVLQASSLETIDNLDFPSGFVDLGIWSSKLRELKNAKLPKGLKKLNVWSAKLSAVEFEIPPVLEELVLNDNTILELANFTLPSTLKTFSCDSCATQTVRGIRWPSTLEWLILRANPITNFEIRESDLKSIQRAQISADQLSQPSCADATASRVAVNGVSLCVISDAAFESRYSGNHTDTSHPTITAPPVSSRSNHTLVLVLSLVGGSVVLTVIIVGFLFYRRSKSGKFDFATASTTRDDNSSKDAAHSDSSLLGLTTDFCNDKAIAASRIEYQDLTIQAHIARGGYGIVYRGTHCGRDVAIKQMLPDAWKNDKMLVGFLDEIRLCANLEHPKIVAFVGVAWSSMRDLSVVIEFMDGGDLSSLLQKHPESTGVEWFEPWTPAHVRSKSLIAMDIAEALVYLHSFENPILHRDLKAKNVLLDHMGNAKLSDFGISRAMTIDETMTSEIGTVAWIAPEVLRGERYNEKADIYSLGVLLVEMDRCGHPYETTTNSESMAHKNTQIAVMVSTGMLKPHVTNQCPSDVASLIAQCLEYEADTRPTAMEIFYLLRQLRRYAL